MRRVSIAFVRQARSSSALAREESDGHPGHQAEQDGREVDSAAAGSASVSALDVAETLGADETFAADAIHAVLAILAVDASATVSTGLTGLAVGA